MTKAPKRTPSNLAGFGLDYGLGFKAAAIGSIEFNKNLAASEIVAVVYGFNYSRTLGARVPAITLLGRNKESLQKAFEEFSNWASWTNPDAIEVTIVFTREGGYRLCIGPEITALYKRAFQYNSVVNPMAFQTTWIKPFDTASKTLRELRKMLSTGIIRPYLLEAAQYNGLRLSAGTFIPELMEPVSLERELLKFEIRFVDEGSEHDQQWQRIALVDRECCDKPAAADKTTPKPLVWSNRDDALKRLFPVTLWRSRSVEACGDLRRAAERLGLYEWQIDQALCNLTLSREIAGGNFHFRGLRKRDWPEQVWNALGERYEVADAAEENLQGLGIESIVRQTILDARVLLRHYRVKRVPTKLKGIQHLLQRHSLHCLTKE